MTSNSSSPPVFNVLKCCLRNHQILWLLLRPLRTSVSPCNMCLSIAACCYCKGRRQRQSRSRHSQLLHALSSTAQHVSTPARPQSGAYPMPPPSSQLSIESTSKFPVARIPSSASSAASCGLPGCSTSYERPSTVLLDPAGSARFFPIAHDALQAISHVDPRASAPFNRSSPRQTGISSLVG